MGPPPGRRKGCCGDGAYEYGRSDCGRQHALLASLVASHPQSKCDAVMVGFRRVHNPSPKPKQPTHARATHQEGRDGGFNRPACPLVGLVACLRRRRGGGHGRPAVRVLRVGTKVDGWILVSQSMPAPPGVPPAQGSPLPSAHDTHTPSSSPTTDLKLHIKSWVITNQLRALMSRAASRCESWYVARLRPAHVSLRSTTAVMPRGSIDRTTQWPNSGSGQRAQGVWGWRRARSERRARAPLGDVVSLTLPERASHGLCVDLETGFDAL